MYKKVWKFTLAKEVFDAEHNCKLHLGVMNNYKKSENILMYANPLSEMPAIHLIKKRFISFQLNQGFLPKEKKY